MIREAGRGHPVLAAVDMADGAARQGMLLDHPCGRGRRARRSHRRRSHRACASHHRRFAQNLGPSRDRGGPVEIRTPGEALDAGIAYLTEDRKALGLFLDMSCLDNINLAVLGRDAGSASSSIATRRATVPAGLLRRSASALPNIGVTAGGLSGGNQQKVLLSRLLATAPKVLILDEPTRGVDVGAKSEIYSIIDNLAKAGTAILVISSDLPEIIGICDRVIVMRSGHIAGEIKRSATSPLNQEDIMALATGMEPFDA